MYKGTELQDEPADKCNAVGPVTTPSRTPTPTTASASAVTITPWPAKPPPGDAGGGGGRGGGGGGGKENLCLDEVMTSLPGDPPDATRKKLPLQRKQSNLTSDSGRSSTSATNDNLDSIFQDDVEIARRHSLNCVDSTGHLNVPGLSDSTDGEADGVQQLRTSASYTALNSKPAAVGDGCKKAELAGVCVKRAPKIVYSHSEDRLLTQSCDHRPIIPALPYSPTASPRLRRQPTMETHRVSVSDGDGFTQLNQYRLKDEIGKVRSRSASFRLTRLLKRLGVSFPAFGHFLSSLWAFPF